jgi:hypothetical protein
MKPFSIVREVIKAQGVFTLSFALLLFLTGGYFFGVPQFARAAAMTSVQDVISTSALSAAANHTITFTMPAGQTWVAGETLTLTFDDTGDAFNFGTLLNSDPLDYDIKTDTGGTPVEETIVANGGCTADEIEITTVNTSTDVITFTACGSYTAPPNAATYEIEIGLHTDSPSAGDSQISNPGSANAYQIDLAGTIGSNDTGTAMVAITPGVTVSVTVDESLTLAIAEESDANCSANIPGTDHSDDAAHTDTVIDFGTVSTGNAFHHSCHLVTVSTNASQGYTTTVTKSQLLTNPTPTTIADGSCEASCSATVTDTWTTTTQNGFGYCLEDVGSFNAAKTIDASDDSETGTTDWVDGAQCDDATPEFKLYPTTATTEPVMKSYSAVSGDQIRMGATLNVPGSQEAGAYTTTLTFVTTPLFN